jgi:hypothetical protein
VNEQTQNPLVKGLGALTLLLAFTLFMATPFSRAIWIRLHPLQAIQFPWRWLAITSMAGSLLLALAIPSWMRLAKTARRPLAILAIGTFAVSLTFSIRHIIRDARWLTPAQFDQTLRSIPGSEGINHWLPIWVHEPLPKMATQVEAGDRKITVEAWAPERRVFQIGAGDSREARIKTFYYPHWTAIAGERQLPIRPDQNGAISIVLPREAATITLEFREPRRVRYAAGLTLLAWLFIGGLWLKRTRAQNFPPVLSNQ